MTIADAKECKAFLDAHPEIQFFEILFTNMAGRAARQALAPP